MKLDEKDLFSEDKEREIFRLARQDAHDSVFDSFLHLGIFAVTIFMCVILCVGGFVMSGGNSIAEG